MDTLTVAGPGQQKRPRCFMTTMRAILRKDERNDKLDLLSHSGRGEFIERERERERERELPSKFQDTRMETAVVHYRQIRQPVSFADRS